MVVVVEEVEVDKEAEEVEDEVDEVGAEADEVIAEASEAAVSVREPDHIGGGGETESGEGDD